MDTNTFIHCPKCHQLVKRENLIKHQQRVHGASKYNHAPIILTDQERIEKIKTHNYYLLVRASIISNHQFLDEENEKKRTGILYELNSLKSKYRGNSPENRYLQEVVNFLLETPTLQEYRSQCDKIFITWDNIEFLDKKIKIKHKDHFSLKPINIVNSKESLNLIKIEYFKRVYHNQIYKLYLKNNEVVESISHDLEKIRAVIEIQLEEIKKKKEKGTRTNEKVFPKNASQSVILNIISTLPENKFKFIKSAAKFLNEGDQVLAFDENNNNNIEEALIFIFKRPRFNLVLWENLNDKRGAYLFEYSQQNFNQELSRLVTLLKGSTHNKREKFFRNEDNFYLDYKSKLFLNHEDLFRYNWQLKKYLNTNKEKF